MELAGRVVLITGAAKRIGRATALRLARSGCRIAVHFGQSADAARRTAQECRGAGAPQAEAFACDLSDASATAALPARVAERLGGLDVLINNASIFEPMTVDAFELGAWERTLRVNLTAPMVLVHAARTLLRASGAGRVINLCDAATGHPWPGHLAYMVSKGALETLTRVLARALAPDTNVVGIAPGVAAWPEHYDAELRRRLAGRIPLGRAGTPEEIAAAIHYVLAEGDYVTGTVLTIDGGRHLGT